MSAACLGCSIANSWQECQVVYEDDYVTCVLDIAPLNEGHTLILPKRHYAELVEMDPAVLEAVMEASVHVSKALSAVYKPDGISVIQNGGQFNDLGHYHMHVFPRYQGDGFGWKEPEQAANPEQPGLVKDKLQQVIQALLNP
ncbi:HIT family protein [Paenibacillus albus]|uniref:HIT family protein n=1 Tax=Paenibacillus albus TaxID=2495582 RepID=A0A3Q8X5R3_9BACL|nr:HIT family protein [Paenibacillus albus]AZN40987.1 HIT family protein [Paenibacillus albus]